MGDLFQPWHLIILFTLFFVTGPLIIVPYWQILKKAGFPPALSVLIMVPLVNLILLYYVAFSDWKPGAGSVTPI
jgi:hypothetical protein